jgi:HSP90 family molecular chaperone
MHYVVLLMILSDCFCYILLLHILFPLLTTLRTQEPADEYCIGHVKDFEGKKLTSIDKEGVKLGDEDEKSLKSLEKHYKQEYTPLTDYLKGLYKNKVCICSAC